MCAKLVAIILAIFFMLHPTVSSAAECEYCNDSNPSCFIDTYGVIYCQGVLVYYPENLELVEYYVDARAHTIGESAFAENEHIQEVIIPNSVVMIDDCAFEGCLALRTVHLPDSLLIIGANAFSICTSLEQIPLPDSLYCIGSQAFCDTWSLHQIVLPESLRFVGAEAFAQSGIQEAFIHSVFIECGYDVFTPSSLDYGKVLLLHFPQEVLSEEIGNVYSWIDQLQKSERIVISFDILDDE